MEHLTLKISLTVILILTITISGIILRIKERPYNKILIGFHKIIVLSALVFISMLISGLIKNGPIDSNIITMIVVTAILTISSFITGVAQSFEKPVPVIFSITHKISSYLAIISLSLMMTIIT